MALFYFYAWNVSMQSAPEAATDHLANRRNEGAEKGRGTVRETGEGWRGRIAAWVYKQLLYDALFSARLHRRYFFHLNGKFLRH